MPAIYSEKYLWKRHVLGLASKNEEQTGDEHAEDADDVLTQTSQSSLMRNRLIRIRCMLSMYTHRSPCRYCCYRENKIVCRLESLCSLSSLRVAHQTHLRAFLTRWRRWTQHSYQDRDNLKPLLPTKSPMPCRLVPLPCRSRDYTTSGLAFLAFQSHKNRRKRGKWWRPRWWDMDMCHCKTGSGSNYFYAAYCRRTNAKRNLYH